MKPRLLDVYCGAGGCTKGYQEAGFEVDGVDLYPQKRYCGSRFFQADALEFLAQHGHEYDAVHASPPCQGYIKAGIARTKQHPKLIEPTRDLLLALGKPYIIENVMDAPLNDPIVLAGTLFGLRVLRYRQFECNFPVMQPIIPAFTGKVVKMGRQPQGDEYISVAGHFTDVEFARQAMGIEWMVRDELAQAIPPAYTRYIGGFLYDYLNNRSLNHILHQLFVRFGENAVEQTK